MATIFVSDGAYPEKLVPLLLSLFILYHFISWIRDPLRDIPGPFFARFTRLWLLCKIWRSDFHETNIELHKRYGPIVRVAPGQYSIDDPGSTKQIYSSGSHAFKKSSFYWAFTFPATVQSQNMFSTQDEKMHAEKRRQVASAYSLSSVLQYESCVETTTATLTTALTKLAEGETKFNLGVWMQYYAYDVIGQVTFSKSFGLLERGHDAQGTLAALDSGNTYSTRIGVYPELHAFFTSALSLFSPRPIRFLLTFITEQIHIAEQRAEFESGEEGPVDFTNKLIAANKQTSDKKSLNKSSLDNRTSDEIDASNAVQIAGRANIIAGSDTTGVSLGAILYHLLKNPRVLEKLRGEIDIAQKSGEISFPIKYKEALELPYLQAVIKEALRIHPALGTLLPRVVPEEGATLVGRSFPAGSVVGINAWVAHRNKSIFGDDAAEFRPERWIECDEERRIAMERYSLGFGGGSRVCIGKWISLLEINKVIPVLVKEWDWELTGSCASREWTLRNVFFVKPQDFLVRVRRRSQN